MLAGEFGVSKNTVGNILKRREVSADQRSAGPSSMGGRQRAQLGNPEQHRQACLEMFSDLGEVPDDPLAAMGWLRKVYLTQIKAILIDPDYPFSEAQRRKEVRDLGRAAAACKDEDALAKVRDQLLSERRRRENRGAGREIVTGAPKRNHRARIRKAGRASRSK